jgi:hypothetical protein
VKYLVQESRLIAMARPGAAAGCNLRSSVAGIHLVGKTFEAPKRTHSLISDVPGLN